MEAKCTSSCQSCAYALHSSRENLQNVQSQHKPRLRKSFKSVSLSNGDNFSVAQASLQALVDKLAPSISPADTHKQENGSTLRDKRSTTKLSEPSSSAIQTSWWEWEGHLIRYQTVNSSSTGPAVLLIHGFGANCDHWRKNLGPLTDDYGLRVFAIDLLGYGFSDKPDPRRHPPNSLYSFETWGRQAADFIREVVGEPAFVICNSVGGVVGLQCATTQASASLVRGLLLLNVSLRMLHITKQQPIARPFVRAFQLLLRDTPLGKLFFRSVANPDAVQRILQQCYSDKDAVTPELVQKILEPGLQEGAIDVFLDFICYSGGPLPEELLPQVQCPAVIAWGEEDPWEPITLARAFVDIPTVLEFVVLPKVGHCPQDEAPGLVNPLIAAFIAQSTKQSPSLPALTVTEPPVSTFMSV